MKPTTDPTTARALIDSAAALAGMTTETPPPLYHDDMERPPLPCIVRDPATGRALHLRRETYPAARAGRLAMSPAWPRDASGRVHIPRQENDPGTASVAPTTEPAALARRLRRYLEDTHEAHEEATRYATQADAYAQQTAETIAALVAAGWNPPTQHNSNPSLPTLPGNAYAYNEQVSGDRVSLELRSLTIDQAREVTLAVLRPGALRRLLDLAAAQLDQSATHDGLANADALAAVRAVIG